MNRAAIADAEAAIVEQLKAQPMPTFDELYAFLKQVYKHDRFAGRDNVADGWKDYSATVTRSCLERLEQYGWDLISHHEAARGTVIFYDRTLTIRDRSPLNEARAQFGEVV
jgi:hypothetical protein